MCVLTCVRAYVCACMCVCVFIAFNCHFVNWPVYFSLLLYIVHLGYTKCVRMSSSDHFSTIHAPVRASTPFKDVFFETNEEI